MAIPLSNIPFEAADQYAQQHSSASTSALQALYQYTIDNVRGSQMVSGPLQGKFLEMIASMLHPATIVELGTYTGYATICLAYGLKQNGIIHTIDIDSDLQEIRDKYWEAAGIGHKVKQHIGKALDILPLIKENIDLAFIDADKANYIPYLNLLISKMNNGSHILADNTLFHGDVLKPVNEQGKNGQYMHAFNEYVLNHPQLESVLLPFRDGITLIRIKK